MSYSKKTAGEQEEKEEEHLDRQQRKTQYWK